MGDSSQIVLIDPESPRRGKRSKLCTGNVNRRRPDIATLEMIRDAILDEHMTLEEAARAFNITAHSGTMSTWLIGAFGRWWRDE